MSTLYSFVEDGFAAPAVIYALINKTTNKLESVSVAKPFELIANKGVTSGEGDSAVSLEENYGYYYTDTVAVPSDYENYTLKVLRWNSISGLTPAEASVELQ